MRNLPSEIFNENQHRNISVWQEIEWVKEKGYVYICESPIDTATLWKWDEPGLGTMQAILTEEQIALIKELPVPVLIAAQDNDKAGTEGANRLRDKSGKLVKRLMFPEGKKDINVMTYEEFTLADRSIIY